MAAGKRKLGGGKFSSFTESGVVCYSEKFRVNAENGSNHEEDSGEFQTENVLTEEPIFKNFVLQFIFDQ